MKNMRHGLRERDKAKIFIKLHRKLYQKRFIIIGIALFFLLIIFFYGFFKMVFFLLLLLILNIGSSYLAKHIPRAHASIELMMFGTVLVALAYGGKVGMYYGVVSAILYYYAVGRFSYYVAILAPLYALVGIIVPYFSEFSVVKVGMVATVAYLVVSSILVSIIFRARIYKIMQFALVNIPFNFIMFKYIAPFLIAIM